MPDISKPEITETISGYKFHWASEKLSIAVSRLHLHNDGRLTGNVSMTLGSAKQQEPSFSFNFNSAPTRKQLINSLIAKFPQWSWLEIIDQLCRDVQRLTAAGEPVRAYETNEEMEPPKYLLEPILMEGLPTVIFGKKGVAKSTLAQLFYIILSLPWHDNPFGLVTPEHPVKTAILDYELPGNLAQWNVKKMVEGNDLGSITLYHRHSYLPLADDIEEVSRYLAELDIEVLIIDSMARAVGGELLKDTDNANRFFTALDKLKITSLIIAQTSWDDENTGKNIRKHIYGNTMFTYYARSIFELCKSEGPANELNVALFHRWSNLTALHEPIGFQFTYNGNQTRVDAHEVNYAQFLDKVSGQLQIIEVLKRGALSRQDIIKETGMKGNSVSPNLKRLLLKKQIVELKDGKYGLAENSSFK